MLHGIDNERKETGFRPKLASSESYLKYCNQRLTQKFQPIVNIQNGQMAVMSYDTSWRGGEKPASLSMCYEIVLDRMFAAMKEFKELGITTPFGLYIRFSEVSDLFVDTLISCALRAEMPLSKIVVELSELREVNLTPLLVGHLRTLRLAGVNLIMHRNSSIAEPDTVLKKLPLSIVKYSRSVLVDFGETQRSQIRASIRRHQELGISLAVGDLNYLGEWELAREMGFDFGQGGIVSAAMNKSEVCKWFSSWKKMSPILCPQPKVASL